ncbi:AzlD domain-containing protein [Consotaella salsifontis]|uniref:Branched-chain amino acid transport protein (AzlD) n=1 Tax=Consotaella salsifontis TaxID=1365950 RepID=A0A1T4L3V8_9HYPH|nr:AzlD domain-containing protein [Consotaella salsifontis]SJZ49200.1 Branched-chain amino acid transport protein (AzlD) [Consotaella salsifontis]
MTDGALPDWQLWAVVLGGGIATIALRLVPLVLGDALASEGIRRFFDRAGTGVLGGIIATSALRTGQTLLTGVPAAGPAVALLAVIVAFALAAWRGGTILPTAAGLALILLAGLV